MLSFVCLLPTDLHCDDVGLRACCKSLGGIGSNCVLTVSIQIKIGVLVLVFLILQLLALVKIPDDFSLFGTALFQTDQQCGETAAETIALTNDGANRRNAGHASPNENESEEKIIDRSERLERSSCVRGRARSLSHRYFPPRRP